MIEALTPVLEKYRSRRDGYLSTASAYKGCHVAKGIELRKLAAVCDMHIRELQAAIEGWQSVPAIETTATRRRARNTAQTVAEVGSESRPAVRQDATNSQYSGEGSGQVDVPEVRHDHDGPGSGPCDSAE